MMTSDSFVEAHHRAVWLSRLTTAELADWLAAVQGECTARGLYVGDLLSQCVERIEARTS